MKDIHITHTGAHTLSAVALGFFFFFFSSFAVTDDQAQFWLQPSSDQPLVLQPNC